MGEQMKHHLLIRLAVAVQRFKDDPTNPKRIKTIENLIEELRELSNEN